MKPIMIDYANRKIILSSAFEKRALTPGTAEYEQLQAVRRDFVGFELATRKFKKNTKQDHHKGLTYDYMRWYIQKYDKDHAPAALAVLDQMQDIAAGHSTCKRYPIIKSWFLDRYPDYTEFGMTEAALQEYRRSKESEADNQGGTVTALDTPKSDAA